MSNIPEISDDSQCETDLTESHTSQKRPRPSESFYEIFICPVCYEYLSPPVIRCPKDHNLCLTCFERMELLSSGCRCPTCRFPIDKENRNRFVEEQLGQLMVSCRWKEHGCDKRISLSERGRHERVCDQRPGWVNCYFRKGGSGEKHCDWKGKISDLCAHLCANHKGEVHARDTSITFLWNPPEEDALRVRPRLLKIKFPSDGSPDSLFILEHVYTPKHKVGLFLVRSLDPDIQLAYSISLQDRQHPEMALMFKGVTMNFESEEAFGLDEFPDCDLRQVFQVPFKVMHQFKFIHEEDIAKSEYFSVHVKFEIPPKETYE